MASDLHETNVRRVVSGAQTGADRAALDAALEAGVPIGGWVPKGRRAEDGRVPDRYAGLLETPGDDYETRTRWNVRDADATLIFSHGPLTGGSSLTRSIACSSDKPFLHVDLSEIDAEDAVAAVREWLADHGVETLNVAGPRASGDPAIYDATRAILRDVLEHRGPGPTPTPETGSGRR